MSLPKRLSAIVERVRRSDEGQGLAEYALILALIAIVAIIALIFLGSQISDKLSVIGSTLESVQNWSRHRADQRSVRLPDGPLRVRARRPDREPCEPPCGTHGFLPILPNGPSPLV